MSDVSATAVGKRSAPASLSPFWTNRLAWAVWVMTFAPYMLVTVWLVVSVVAQGADPLLSVGRAYSLYTLGLPAWCFLLAWAGLAAGRRFCSRSVSRAAFVALAVGLLSAGARVYATHIEPNLLIVRHVRIESPKVNRPVRLLHVSDIQTDRVGAHDRRAFRLMAELKPDLIIHTGDLLHPVVPATFQSELPPMARLWAGLEPPLGKWNAVGDTDLHITPQLLKGGQVVGGLQTLHADDAVVSAGKTRLRLFGLSLAQSRGGQGMQAQVARWLDEEEGERSFNILFGHAPDFVLHREGQAKADLNLAGHTHGGQIRVPFFGPPLTFSAVPRDWARGFHQTPAGPLNVSAGIGAEHHGNMPAIRVNCPPEMTLIELVPAPQNNGR